MTRALAISRSAGEHERTSPWRSTSPRSSTAGRGSKGPKAADVATEALRIARDHDLLAPLHPRPLGPGRRAPRGKGEYEPAQGGAFDESLALAERVGDINSIPAPA